MSFMNTIKEKEAMLDKALSSPDAGRIKLIAKQFKIANMIPESVKTNLKSVIEIAKSIKNEDKETVVAYAQLATKTIIGVCEIIGVDVK